MCTIDKPAGSEQDRFRRAGGRRRNRRRRHIRGYYLLPRLSQRQNDCRRETVFGPCSTTVFSVKKEMPDGLSVLFYSRDVSPL